MQVWGPAAAREVAEDGAPIQRVEFREIRGRDDPRSAETLISYDEGSGTLSDSPLEFQGDRIACVSIHVPGAGSLRSGGSMLLG